MDSPILSDRTAYTYESIPGPDCIRLLHLEPALHADAPIRFSFEAIQLSKVVAQYEAISYTWGEPKLIHPLYVDDGTHVLVTKNLYKALRRLRHPTTVRVLWADAVCINQVDNEEKSTQIPLMARIFRGASKVLAWLDDGADEERGLMMLERFSRYRVYGNDDEKLGDETLPENDPYTSGDNVLIHKFLNLTWFTRLWIIQEIVVNTDIDLICGVSSISWLRFAAALELYMQPRYTSSIDPDKIDAIQVITKLWDQNNRIVVSHTQRILYLTQEGILDLVETFHGYGCADPRDRIFALYNMTMDLQPSNYRGKFSCVRMDVNYSSSVKQVYQEFASACLAARRPVLDAVLARQYSPRPGDWPSWVPDWRNQPSYGWPSTSRLDCHKVAHDIIGITHWSRIEDFPVIDHIFMSPDTVDESMESLAMLCHDKRHTDLLSILSALMPSRSEKDRNVFAEHMTMIRYGDSARDLLTTVITQMSLDLHAKMQHRRFFVANDPRFASILGFGNAAMTKGDRMIRFGELFQLGYKPRYDDVLLLRPYATRTGIEDVDIVTHKLIGSGVIVVPSQLENGYSTGPKPTLYIE
jgi:hypothetical protein